MRVLLIVFICVAAICVLAEDAGEIDAFIQKLGSSSYQERQDASTALRRIGLPAREALEKAVQSNDPEIRIRAVEILRDIKHGINPTWPEDVRRKIRDYDKLNGGDRKALMIHLVTTFGEEAIPFLMTRVEKGEAQDADLAVEQLGKMPDKKAVWEKMLGQKRKTVNKYQARLLVSACEWSKDPSDIARVLKSEHLETNGKTRLMNLALEILRGQFDGCAYRALEKNAKAFAENAPDEARFLYFQALALSELGRKEEAGELERKALALNPDSESCHFTAGEMLIDMGRYRLSEMEWKKILELPPADEVYDINAYMRLGSLYSRCDMYSKAADMLEEGLEKYKTAKEKHGSGMGMIGGDQLEGRIAYLRKKAREAGGDNGWKVKDVGVAGKLKITITPTVKDGKAEELAKELGETVTRMTANVQPYGLRLFEKTAAGLEYDPAKKELVILLNNSPCTKPTQCELKLKTAKVGLINLDMCYIYKVDRDTGKAEKAKRFEKDYTLRIEPGTAILAWKDTVITLNGKKYTWEKLVQGVPFDYLPQELELDIKGTTAAGEERKINKKFDPAQHMKSGGMAGKPTVIKLSIQVK